MSLPSATLKSYLEAAGVAISDAMSLINAGWRIVADGDITTAIAIVDVALALAPEDVRVLRGASGILSVARNYPRCEALMQRAVALEPGNAEYRLHYAIVMIEMREFVRARKELDEHFRLDPESGLGWRMLSAVLSCMGDYPGACEAAEKSIAIDSGNREYTMNRVGLLLVLQRVQEALQDLRRLEKDTPDDASVARLMSAAYEVAGDNDSAFTYAKRAYELAPDRLEYEQHLEHFAHARGIVNVTGAQRRLDPRFPPVLKIEHSPLSRFFDAAVTTIRVIFSLIIREARTRFGGTRLGYVWAIFEPVSHLMLLAVVFSFMHPVNDAPIGDSLLVYYFTGVLPYILFTNTIAHVQVGLEANKYLLQIPIIKPLDVLCARALLELLTQVSVAMIMLTAFGLYGLNSVPNDIARCAGALVVVWAMAVGFGVVNGVIMHFIKSWDHIFANLVRALYFISGIFLSPLAMPPYIRDILVWNPLLQGIDLFRTGFFAYYDPSWLDIPYLAGFSLSVFTLGFGMERALRRRLSSPG